MKSLLGKLLLPLFAAAMLVLAIYHVVKAQQTLPKPPPPVEPARTPFGKTVAGAGIVEAQTENIALGSPLPGVVLEVFVPVDKVGQRVHAGDPLFRVDDRQLRAQLKYYEANLSSARAQVAKLQAQPRPEEVPPSQAKVENAQANLDLLQDQYQRAQKLLPGRAMAEEDYRSRRFQFEVGRQQLAQAEAEHKLLLAGAWQPDIKIAQAAVDLAQAQVDMTKVDLERALVRVPEDGKTTEYKVLQVNVRPGEFVGAPPSQALVVLGSMQKMNVRVDIDEHDIPRAYRYFQPGGKANASPRGDPSLKFPLSFVRVEPYVVPKKSLTGDNTERVDTRVLQVIYEVDTDQPSLFVGMQLDVFIDGDLAGPSPSPGDSPGADAHTEAVRK